MLEVARERTGWRDAEISGRHRAWGFNCPAVDLDFVMLEFNRAMPVALIEYKEKRAREPVLHHPSYRALSALADGYQGGPLPFFVAFYCRADWWFRVLPVNASARAFYGPMAGVPLAEQRFVRSLYALRKQAMTAADEAVIAQLNAIVPEAA